MEQRNKFLGYQIIKALEILSKVYFSAERAATAIVHVQWEPEVMRLMQLQLP